jgi:hypothetical protein
MDGQLLSATFVELTDTMVADFDVIDFLHVLTDRSAQLLDVSAAGLLLADPRGELRVVAASSEAARLLELFQLQNDQGPCLECFRTGRPVTAADLKAEAQRWPRFAVAAQDAGFAAVQALPMRLRDQVIGALNLFRATPGPFDPSGVRIGQALADVATISLLHERNMRHSDTLNEQLQTALNSRVIIEQAKGKLAERLGLDMDQAFSLLRDHARARNLRMSDLAQAFIDGTEPLIGPPAPREKRRSSDGDAPGQARRQLRRALLEHSAHLSGSERVCPVQAAPRRRLSEAAVQRHSGAGQSRPPAPHRGEPGNGEPGNDDDGNKVDDAENSDIAVARYQERPAHGDDVAGDDPEAVGQPDAVGEVVGGEPHPDRATDHGRQQHHRDHGPDQCKRHHHPLASPGRLEHDHSDGDEHGQQHKGDQQVGPKRGMTYAARHVALEPPPDEGLDQLVDAEHQGDPCQQAELTALADVANGIDADRADQQAADQVGLG